MSSKPITVITPTRDRPSGFVLCREWISRQTCRDDIDWIVVDDGDTPVGANQSEYRYFRGPASKKKFTNFDNILFGLEQADGQVVMYIEDDDWISPEYVQNMVDNVSGRVAAALCGSLNYHVGYQRYIDNRMSKKESRDRMMFLGSFCVSGIGVEMLKEACTAASLVDDPLIDMRFWKLVSASGLPFNVFEATDIVKIKGIPGRSITWKHRADIGIRDPGEKFLRSLIGDADTDLIVKASKGWENWINRWTNENLQKKTKRKPRNL